MIIDRTGSPAMAQAAETAYQAYPALQPFDIHIRYVDLETTTMQARPRWDLLWRNRRSRSYQIRINRFPQFDRERPIHTLDQSILVGWFVHEMGHLMDYVPRRRHSILTFAILYLTSARYRKKAERVADGFAIKAGMGEFILKTKIFLLEHSNLSDRYKKRLLKHYLTPQQTVELIEAETGPLMEE